jgi:hypothetical protein
MKFTTPELEFLSAWAREEWEPRCYQRPAHRLQLAHGVSGGLFIDLIKSWTQAEDKKDQDILNAAMNPEPTWPWDTMDSFKARLDCARKSRYQREIPAALPVEPPLHLKT